MWCLQNSRALESPVPRTVPVPLSVSALDIRAKKLSRVFSTLLEYTNSNLAPFLSCISANLFHLMYLNLGS